MSISNFCSHLWLLLSDSHLHSETDRQTHIMYISTSHQLNTRKLTNINKSAMKTLSFPFFFCCKSWSLWWKLLRKQIYQSVLQSAHVNMIICLDLSLPDLEDGPRSKKLAWSYSIWCQQHRVIHTPPPHSQRAGQGKLTCPSSSLLLIT